MKLYHHPLSTFSQRIRIALLEKGLEAEQVEVDMPNREHRSEKYLALNPYGRVPTLVDGDFVLYESTAILEYLEDRHPEPSLRPEDIHERAHMRRHMKLCDLELSSNASTIVFPKRFLPKEKWRTDEMDKAKKRIDRHVNVLDDELAGKTYLVGERFTLADLTYIPFIAFWEMLEVGPPDNVAAWTERLLTRKSAIETRLKM